MAPVKVINPLAIVYFKSRRKLVELLLPVLRRLHDIYGRNLVGVNTFLELFGDEARKASKQYGTMLVLVYDSARLGLLELYDRDRRVLKIPFRGRILSHVALSRSALPFIRSGDTRFVLQACVGENQVAQRFFSGLSSYEKITLDQAYEIAVDAIRHTIKDEELRDELAKQLTPQSLKKNFLVPMSLFAPGALRVEGRYVVVGKELVRIVKALEGVRRTASNLYRELLDTYRKVSRRIGMKWVPLVYIYRELIAREAIDPRSISFEEFVKLCEQLSKRHPEVRVTVHPGLPLEEGTWMILA